MVIAKLVGIDQQNIRLLHHRAFSSQSFFITELLHHRVFSSQSFFNTEFFLHKVSTSQSFFNTKYLHTAFLTHKVFHHRISLSSGKFNLLLQLFDILRQLAIHLPSLFQLCFQSPSLLFHSLLILQEGTQRIRIL